MLLTWYESKVLLQTSKYKKCCFLLLIIVVNMLLIWCKDIYGMESDYL
jgi:hypothetical protein